MRKSTTLLFVSASALLALAFVTNSILIPSFSAAQSKEKAKEPKLYELMDEMAGMFRRIGRQVKKRETNAETLVMLAKLEIAVLKAKSMVPDQVKELAKENIVK